MTFTTDGGITILLELKIPDRAGGTAHNINTKGLIKFEQTRLSVDRVISHADVCASIDMTDAQELTNWLSQLGFRPQRQ